MDTVVFAATPDSEKPSLGDYLGDLTNGLTKATTILNLSVEFLKIMLIQLVMVNSIVK